MGDMTTTGVARLTRDPEKVETKSGTSLTKCGIAWNKSKDQSAFADIVLFGDTADRFFDWMSKGYQVFISGDLDYDQWETKDGQKRSKNPILVRNFKNLTPKSENAGNAPAAKATADIPF